MTNWWQFDREDPAERAERQAVATEIASTERMALDAIQQLVALVERHGEIAQHAGSAALTHIATIAQQQGQALFRRTLEHDERRQARNKRRA